MSDIAPYLINTGHVDLPSTFLLPIVTTQERYDMMISALLVGGEVVYGEDEILHFVDFLNALPLVREDTNINMDYPNGYTLAPHQFKTISGGFGSANFLNTVWLSTYWLMTGLNAECSIDLPLQAGNYSVNMLWTKGSTGGDLTAYMDNVSLGAAAGYNATNLNASWSWVANGLTKGQHTLRLKVTGHQPSSTGYNIAASMFYVRINS